MKPLKVKHVLFKIAAQVAHGVRSHLDADKHKEFLDKMLLVPGAGLFVTLKDGTQHYFPQDTINGCILNGQVEEEDEEPVEVDAPAKKRGRPFKVLPDGTDAA